MKSIMLTWKAVLHRSEAGHGRTHTTLIRCRVPDWTIFISGKVRGAVRRHVGYRPTVGAQNGTTAAIVGSIEVHMSHCIPRFLFDGLPQQVDCMDCRVSTRLSAMRQPK